MPAVSQAQQSLMAMAEHDPDEVSDKNKGVLKMSHSQLHDFASTKRSALPHHKKAKPQDDPSDYVTSRPEQRRRAQEWRFGGKPDITQPIPETSRGVPEKGEDPSTSFLNLLGQAREDRARSERARYPAVLPNAITSPDILKRAPRRKPMIAYPGPK
jgi:hypothetical protein